MSQERVTSQIQQMQIIPDELVGEPQLPMALPVEMWNRIFEVMSDAMPHYAAKKTAISLLRCSGFAKHVALRRTLQAIVFRQIVVVLPHTSILNEAKLRGLRTLPAGAIRHICIQCQTAIPSPPSPLAERCVELVRPLLGADITELHFVDCDLRSIGGPIIAARAGHKGEYAIRIAELQLQSKDDDDGTTLYRQKWQAWFGALQALDSTACHPKIIINGLDTAITDMPNGLIDRNMVLKQPRVTDADQDYELESAGDQADAYDRGGELGFIDY